MKQIVALTIAGSDCSGGAGLQADLKTFHQFGLYGMSVVTLVTAQNTQGVSAVQHMPVELVRQQCQAVLQDIPPAAIKTGALGSAEIIDCIAEQLQGLKARIVIDPVMISKHGAPLLEAGAVSALLRFLPRAYLVTPNLPEAAALANEQVTDLAGMERAARKIADLGVLNVLLKGGHLVSAPVDLLFAGGQCHWLPQTRIPTQHTHGTGCVLSAAITAGLALGQELLLSVQRAQRFLHGAIRTNPGLGKGCGPVNLHATLPGRD